MQPRLAAAARVSAYSLLLAPLLVMAKGRPANQLQANFVSCLSYLNTFSPESFVGPRSQLRLIQPACPNSESVRPEDQRAFLLQQLGTSIDGKFLRFRVIRDNPSGQMRAATFEVPLKELRSGTMLKVDEFSLRCQGQINETLPFFLEVAEDGKNLRHRYQRYSYDGQGVPVIELSSKNQDLSPEILALSGDEVAKSILALSQGLEALSKNKKTSGPDPKENLSKLFQNCQSLNQQLANKAASQKLDEALKQLAQKSRSTGLGELNAAQKSATSGAN